MTDVRSVMHAFGGNFRTYESLGWVSCFLGHTAARPLSTPSSTASLSI
jgi:hypothetical protein